MSSATTDRRLHLYSLTLAVVQLTSMALSEKVFRGLPVPDSAHCVSTAVSSRQSDAVNKNVCISLDEEFAS